MKNQNESKNYKTSWLSSGATREEMPWGFSIKWSGFNGMHAKTLYMLAGERTSFKYHRRKNEVLHRPGRPEGPKRFQRRPRPSNINTGLLSSNTGLGPPKTDPKT